MEHRHLGRTGLRVPVVCLGAGMFGNDASGCDEATARAIVDRYLDAGGTMIDVADFYQDGLAEEIVGRALAGRRDGVVLATKVGMSRAPWPTGRGLSRKHVLEGVDASLRRLGVDHIDLYQVHTVDPSTPLEETVGALADCVRSGKVRYVGCSNYEAWRLMKALGIADVQEAPRFCSLQAQFSLLCRDIEREHLPMCAAEGVGVLAWGVLGAGMLTGKVRAGTGPAPGTRLANEPRHADRVASTRNLAIVEALVRAADEVGRTPAQLALAWAAGSQAVSTVIAGVRTVAQLEDNLAAADVVLDPEVRARLDDASQLPTSYPYDYLPTLRPYVTVG